MWGFCTYIQSVTRLYGTRPGLVDLTSLFSYCVTPGIEAVTRALYAYMSQYAIAGVCEWSLGISRRAEVRNFVGSLAELQHAKAALHDVPA